LYDTNNMDEEDIVEAKNSTVGINVQKLSEELMLSIDEINMLVKMFIKKMDKILPELEKYIYSKDYKQISLNAHSIKGSSANFRMEYLQDIAKDMEDMARDNNTEFDYIGAHSKMNEYMKTIKVN